MTEMMIVCPDCHTPKGESHFHARRRTGDLWKDRCLQCREQQKIRRARRHRANQHNSNATDSVMTIEENDYGRTAAR